jgi:hypothetical protein
MSETKERTRGKKKKLNKRLLPGDFTKYIKYDSLDETEKDVVKPKGFFNIPTDMKGVQIPDRDFLVFYFDDHKGYKEVLEYFEIEKNKSLSHPKLDSEKLIKLVKKMKKL